MKTTITQFSEKLKLRWLFIFALLSISAKTNAQCSANFTYSANPADNGEVTFTSTSNGAGFPYFFWEFGDGQYSSGAYLTHTYTTSGTYTVYMEMHDSLSACADTVIATITVTNNSAPPCSASFITDSTNYGYFWNTSAGTGLTSTWSFGDGTSGTSTGDITHTYPSPGIYYVCLHISNSSGCSDTFCDSVHIGAASSGMCSGAVTSYFTAHDSLGYGVFSNSVTGTAPVYHWDFGDGTTSSAIGNTEHFYSSSGTYVVCLTVYETGGTYDSCQYCSSITIGGGSTGSCDASFVIFQDSTNLFNYFIYNNTVGTSPTTSYFWDFGDGTSSTSQYPFHTYPGSGPYFICLTVTDASPAFNCTNTYCDSIVAGHAQSAPITVTVVNPVTTGITETSAATTLKNYPNPFNGSTTISYSISKDANVELNVLDLLGNKIASLESSRKTSGNYSVDWNADNVSGGMYLLQIKVDNEMSTKKIILNK